MNPGGSPKNGSHEVGQRVDPGLSYSEDHLRFATRAQALFMARLVFLVVGICILLVPRWAGIFGFNTHLASFVFLSMLGYSVANLMVIDHGALGRPVTFITLCLDLVVVIYMIGTSGGLYSPLLATQLLYTLFFAMLFPSPLAIVPPLLSLPILARVDQVLSQPRPAIVDLLILLWLFALNAVLVYVVVFLKQRDEAQARELATLHGDMAQLAVAEERNRLARDIHDGLGASLSSLILQAEYSQQLTKSPENLQELQQELSELRQVAEESIEELRRSLRMMREDFDLLPALEEKCRVFGERTHLDIKFERSGAERQLDSETQLTIFRVLQESLNNVAKHAKATHVNVGLAFGEDSLVLTVADDGSGFAESAVSPGHYGLVHLRERARSLLGEASVTSAPGRGTIITLTLPTTAVSLLEVPGV